MTVNQLLGGTWPVVSVPNGAQSAVKSIKDNYEFVCSYSEVVLCLDNDDPGKQATKQIAELLPPGKCKIAKLPYKDANECLINNNGKAVVSAIWEAQQYSPDEILHVSTIVEGSEDIKNVRVYPFPFDSLSEFLIGQRSGEISLWASGTGSGKSTILRELILHHLEEGRSVGAIMLEESPQETMDDMISLILNKPVRAIRACRMMNDLRGKLGKNPINMDFVDDLSDEEYAAAKRKLSGTNFFIYDHLGNNAMQNLLARMEYMAVSLKVDVIVLDHITAAAAGLMGMHDKDIDGGNSERIIIDTLMKELRSIAVRTGVHIDIVSQLKKTEKAYEEGDRITLQDLRGSGALSSVPNTVIALERDRQNADEVIANTTTIRVLKNRLTGRAGIAAALYYDRKTGRLKEVGFAIDDGGQVVFDPNNNVTQGS
jgi:twinkle protein